MKVLKAALPALTLLLPLILLPARANASTLPADSGNFTSTVEITSVRHADGNTIIAGVETQTLTGLFTGTRVRIRPRDRPRRRHIRGPRQRNLHRHRGWSPRHRGHQWLQHRLRDSGSGQLVAGQGNGALAGLHAQGTFEPTITGPTTAEGTYSVQFHFDS